MISACPACLRRGWLLGHLAPRIAGMLDRPGYRAPGLLALGEDDLIAAVAGPRAPAARAFLDAFDPRTAARRLAAARSGAVCGHDARYPEALRGLPDPPPVLFYRGDERWLERVAVEPPVAVVGTRRGSPHGLAVGYALGRGLGAAGLPVVSGLALGVDAAAHRGCLEGGGHAIAVLAAGPDVPYPRRNRRLYARVVATGAVVSELPPGTPVFRWGFPARNRIMAGLAAMTVVVEAGEPSGSLITAEFARDLGRVVGAVPGRVTSRLSAGSNRLLRDGAAVVTAPADVLDELFGAGMRSTPPDGRRQAPDPADPTLKAVLDAVEAGRSVDGIARSAGLSAGETRAALGRLELDGHVSRAGLGAYERAARM